MKPVTMYECPFCQKLFRTPNRHNCRRDPAKTNCYSCEHWGHEFYLEFHRYDCDPDIKGAPELACLKHETSDVESAHAFMREMGWRLNCPDYKLKDTK